VYACAALGVALPATSQAQVTGTVASVTVSEAATIGVPVAIVCSAQDPEGIQRLTVRLTTPNGASTVLAAAFGVDVVEATWTPVMAGSHVVRCRANGLSGGGGEIVERQVDVVRGETAPAPVAAALAPAPADGSTFPAAPPALGAALYQDGLPAKLAGPRRVAATPAGDLFVVDREGRLSRLTRLGGLVGTALEGAVSVAAGSETVFAALRSGSVVELSPRTGRVVGGFDLGTSEPPIGLAYDEARASLWMVYASGVVQVRRPDGSLVKQFTRTPAGALVRLTDVALTPGGIVWVASDRAQASGYLHAFNAETLEFVKSIGSAFSGQARVIGGIAAAWDRLYVSDLFSGNVRVIDANGATIEILGKAGVAAGDLSQPADIAFAGNGDLVVADMDTNRIDRFGVGSPLPACAGDADCDYLPDAWEVANGMDPGDPSNALADADADGLNETEELLAGANPRSADTDGDGYGDAAEVATGFNPADGEDHRPLMAVDVPSIVDPGYVELAASIEDRGRLGGCSAAWRQLGGPVVTFDASAVSPTFIARRGLYKFEATATCAGVASRPAVIDVAVRNLPPRPDAGRIVTLQPGRVHLLAGFSSDANGDSLSFTWDQMLGAPLITSKSGASMSTRAGTPGLYVFRLSADDRAGGEGAAEVPVVVVDAAGAPTAIAGRQVLARAGEAVALDASASYRSATATFLWQQVAGPAVQLDAPSSAAPSFVVPAPGRYTFEVAVLDGVFRSPAAVVDVFAAPADGALPVAVAAATGVAAVNVPVTLDGSGSSAAAGGALSYAWRQVSGPAAGLTRADRASATVVAFSPGSHEFELVVDDGAAVGVPARVRFEARANGVALPRAVASAQASAVVGEIVALDGSASVGATRKVWTQVEGPWVPVASSPTYFRPLVPGVYAFELEVDDGTVRSAPARVEVVVFPNGTEN